MFNQRMYHQIIIHTKLSNDFFIITKINKLVKRDQFIKKVYTNNTGTGYYEIADRLLLLID